MMVHASRFIKQHCADAMPLLVNVYKQFDTIKTSIPGFHDLRSLHMAIKSKGMTERMNEKFRALNALREELGTFT